MPEKKAKKWYLIISAIVILAALVLAYGYYQRYRNSIPENKTLNREFKTKIKSGNLSVDYEIGQAIEDIDTLRLNTLNVPVEVDISDLKDSTASVNEASIKKAKVLMEKLKGKGINIIIEPYPWISGGEAYETAFNPEDVNSFFKSWREDVLKVILKQVAVPERADAVCIASNFVNLEKYEAQWCETADYVRENYSGLVTYKTNWWYTAGWNAETKESFHQKLQNKVFSKVDFISIADYFELSDKPENSVEDLKADLYSSTAENRKQNIIDEISQLHDQWKKPIFFGELGFPRRDYAAMHPWDPSPSQVENGSEQARCFEAYRQAFTQDWFLGFSVFSIGNRAADKNYYPSSESVEVIKGWF
ncbi:MAG: hydrolase [Bacillota bacterium]|nr:hydrolase [Bacillota bacterium]